MFIRCISRSLSSSRHRPSGPPKRARRWFSLEGLEDRQLLSFTTQFLGVTPVADGVQYLESFNSATPGSFADIGPVTGLSGGDVLRGLSTRPSDGQLFGFALDGSVGAHGQLYSINPKTAAATRVGFGITDAGFLLNTTELATAFDPTTNRLHILTPQGHDYDIASDTGYSHLSVLPSVSGLLGASSLAYTNPTEGSSSATAYVVDTVNTLAHSSVTDGTLSGFKVDSLRGLSQLGRTYGDLVIGPSNDAYVANVGLASTDTSDLYSVDLLKNTLSLKTALPKPLTAFTAMRTSVVKLSVSGLHAGGTAGAGGTLTVTALDSQGNVATGYSGTVHFTSTDPQAVLPADATLTNGVGNFAVVLRTAGARSVAATDTTNASLADAVAGITVSPAAAATFTVSGRTSLVAGTAGTVTVTALDAFGNVATGYSGLVHLTSTDGSAVLSPDAAMVNGIGTFSVQFATAGNQSVTATDTANVGVTGIGPNVTVVAMIRGAVYLDLSANGTRDGGEPEMAGRIVYVDVNHDGIHDPGDPTATTDSLGHFSFPGIAVGTGPVVEDTTNDVIDRLVVDQTTMNADGTIFVGAVPISTVAPLPVVPSPFNPGPAADPTAAYAQALYHAVLGRNGFLDEVAYWVQQMASGMSRQLVAMSFVHSAEHYTQEVNSYYSRYLHRTSDAGGMNYYVKKLSAGATEMSVVESFLSSPEFQNSHTSAASFVGALYDSVLARYGSPSELSYWTQQIAYGMSRTQIQLRFVESPEELRYIVIAYYSAFLHRAPDSLSTGFTGQLEPPNGTPTTVAVSILSSPEFFKIVQFGGR